MLASPHGPMRGMGNGHPLKGFPRRRLEPGSATHQSLEAPYSLHHDAAAFPDNDRATSAARSVLSRLKHEGKGVFRNLEGRWPRRPRHHRDGKVTAQGWRVANAICRRRDPGTWRP